MRTDYSNGTDGQLAPLEDESKAEGEFWEKYGVTIAEILLTGGSIAYGYVTKTLPPISINTLPQAFTQVFAPPMKFGLQVSGLVGTIGVNDYNKGGIFPFLRDAGSIGPPVLDAISGLGTMAANPKEITLGKVFEVANTLSGPTIRLAGHARGMDDEDLEPIYFLADIAGNIQMVYDLSKKLEDIKNKSTTTTTDDDKK